jgi:hypothetical protein
LVLALLNLEVRFVLYYPSPQERAFLLHPMVLTACNVPYTNYFNKYNKNISDASQEDENRTKIIFHFQQQLEYIKDKIRKITKLPGK